MVEINTLLERQLKNHTLFISLLKEKENSKKGGQEVPEARASLKDTEVDAMIEETNWDE